MPEVQGSGSPGPKTENSLPVSGFVPAILPEQLGDPSFCTDHGIRFPYVAGAMANGIASVEIVVAMANAGMLGFFGAAGLDHQTIGRAIDRIKEGCNDRPFGVNLIHTPQEAAWEDRMVSLLIEKKVHLIEASAYLSLTLPVVRYRVHGIHEDASGKVITPNHVIAKVSRVEVASRFLAPAPEKFLKQLVDSGEITAEQARLAARVPMADDITAEADSGGHTDNRPAIALLPTLVALRDRLREEHGYERNPRIGLGGGIATPASAAAAFSMGAAYILTGSINQSCLESGTSDTVRAMLAQAQQADTAMAPAADMFEMGVNVQVLKRGTMFAMRATRLYELYRAHRSIEEISERDRASIEKSIFRTSLDDIWQQTHSYFQTRDPAQIERAERDPRHKMALIFRWYLGKSSHWANHGEPSRKVDYQVWCGPGMGAFNEWVRGSFLEAPEQRKIVTLAWNLLYGAALQMRLNALRQQGVTVGPVKTSPREPEQLKELFQ